MRIVHHGLVPGSALRRQHCQSCKALIEFEEREAIFVPDPVRGAYFKLNCPGCSREVVQSQSVATYDPEKIVPPPNAIDFEMESARVQLHQVLERTGSVHHPRPPQLMRMAAVQLTTLLDRLG